MKVIPIQRQHISLPISHSRNFHCFADSPPFNVDARQVRNSKGSVDGLERIDHCVGIVIVLIGIFVSKM